MMMAGKLRSNACARVVTLVAAAIIAMAVGTGTQAADAKRVLRSADVHTEDYPTVQAVIFMGQIVSKKTNGKLGIRVFDSGLLGDEGPLLDLVKAGKLDMTRISAQALDPASPQMRVLSLPYLFRDIQHLHKVLDGPIGKEILDSLRPQGLIGLAYFDAGVRNIYTAKKPIRTLDDMKDLAIRVQPTPLATYVFELLQARPVRLPFVQTGRALKTGIVEAGENNSPTYSSEEHFRSAPFYSLTHHSMSPDVLVISRQVWDKLSVAEQNLLRSAARESMTMMRDMWVQREERVEASLKLAGIKFNDIPPQELARFEAAVQPAYARFAADPVQQDLIRRIRAVQ
ncbi:TRAP transporter substrate-binding protein [Uliginosibacterium sp. H3]|uniref:TRAP transporter substrate-binding protein n=1 Tax=Uliginosibacterium silvisoli TaxID=3114758 RepID=A0ABU6K1U1_9RHOO|nr:TRAP transporter substrate-binding protein [Uliginosibacterium sp. H3]